MKDISIKAASPKEVFERAFESKIFTCEHSKDKVKTHSKNVCRICEDIALQLEKNGIKVRKKLLKKVAYFHGKRIRFLSLLIYPFKSLQALIFQGFGRFFHFCCHAGNLRRFP